MKSAFALALVAACVEQASALHEGRQAVYREINSGKMSNYNTDKQSLNKEINFINGSNVSDSNYGLSYNLRADISYGYRLLAWWYPYEFRDALIFNPTFFLEGAAHAWVSVHVGEWFTTTFKLEGVGYRFNIFDMLLAYDPDDRGYCYDGTFWTEAFYLKLYLENSVNQCHKTFLGGTLSGEASPLENIFGELLSTPVVQQLGGAGCYPVLYTPQLPIWEMHFDESIDFLEEFNREENWIDWTCSGDGVSFDRGDYEDEADDASNEQDNPFE